MAWFQKMYTEVALDFSNKILQLSDSFWNAVKPLLSRSPIKRTQPGPEINVLYFPL